VAQLKLSLGLLKRLFVPVQASFAPDVADAPVDELVVGRSAHLGRQTWPTKFSRRVLLKL
jgi:hypothetical protein